MLTDELILIATDNQWTDEGVGHVYAFEKASGKVRWKHRERIGVPTDVVRIGERVFAVNLADELICLDLKTGRLEWRFAGGPANDSFHMTASPAVLGTHVYFGTVEGKVHAIDARSGKAAWTKSLGDRVTATLLVDRDDLYVGTSTGRMIRLDRKTGRVAAEIALPDAPRFTPALTHDAVLVFAGKESFICLERSLENVRWAQTGSSPWRSSQPLVIDRTVLVGDLDGNVVAFDIDTGMQLWARSLCEDIRSLGAADGRFYAGTKEGTLYAWVADE